MKLKRISSSILTLLVAASLMAGCSSQTSTDTGAAGETESTATEAAATTEETADKEGNEAADTTAEAAEVTYPITITHAFGETVIESEPQRVATISWGNQDVPLALGVVPVGISKANYGAVNETGLLPWTAAAYEELGVANEDIVVFDDTDGLNYEAISDSNPDVILAAYSGITQEEYDLLSQIAPVVAYPEYAWQTYWRDQVLMDAKGMGKEAEAKELIAQTDELISTKVSEHSVLEGKTAAFMYFSPSDLGTFYVYLPVDPRAAYLTDLGLAFPESVTALAEGETSFTVTVSAENIDQLTGIDIIVTYGDASVLETLQADSLVGTLPAIANGSVVMIEDTAEISASCTPSILSIPATIDEYLSLLSEAAEKVK
ncbi:iron-siderophore ABC transporter substrate-binding protein [Konateibacter massiliensis]|uniref:iron-siderophore ABC transporter substrate-binding protein n=1 Tax=Konateibacter massiliensis TaxID=2002841 RepID=UPI000C14E17C|nr:iron-siderophore ABC transporter substrate-binding protein [Konateibacter massiliensis]